MLIDYHLHNHFSPDSSEKTRKIAEKALERGMQEICITNHVEWHDKITGKAVLDLEKAIARFKQIKAEIDEVQQDYPQLPIKFGAELEYVPGHMDQLSTFVQATPLDFVLGSVHIVNGVIIASHLFADQLYREVDEETAYLAYFELLEKMVNWGHFDVVAHFDICKKAGVEFYGPFQPEKYKPQILSILNLMKEKGIGLELNTKCIDNKCREVFPHPTILKWAVEVGIEHFTLSSDAHSASKASKYIKDALEIAKSAGIKYISTYKKRRPQLHPI